MPSRKRARSEGKGKRRKGQSGRKKGGQSTAQVDPDGYLWSADPSPVTVEPFRGSPGPTGPISDDPLELFSAFFTEELLEAIVHETNRYAAQYLATNHPDNTPEWQTNAEELKAYLGFMVLMGINELPEIRDYWSRDPCLHYSPIASRITRNRFEEICRYLHFIDNDTLPARGEVGYHRLQKILPIITAINKVCLENYNPCCENSIDEAMIPFKGRSSLKQYMPLKPVKRGFKVWVRADSWNGYFCEMEVYTGKAEDGTTEMNLGERVVLKLTEKIAGMNHQVFIDRYFTSVRLFSTLLQHNVYACGTVIATRKQFPEEVKVVSGLEHGEFVFRQAGSIVTTAWKDKKVVYALSNMCDPDSSQPVTRKQKDGTVKLVDCPSTIVAYNKHMGGVDHGDQLRSYYGVRLKSRKFYRYIFWFLFDVVVTNTYILSRYTISTDPGPQSKRTLKWYRLKLAKQLIGSYCTRVRVGRPRLHPLPAQSQPTGPPRDRALLDHLPCKGQSTRCHYCSRVRRPAQRRETVWYCAGCEGQPPLCLSGRTDCTDCFRLWHTPNH